MIELTPTERRLLKAQAHALRPVVTIGGKGLTTAVLKELDLSLKAHELIKVKIGAADRHVREALLEQVCEALGAHPVQHIGRIIVLYRENPAPESDGQVTDLSP